MKKTIALILALLCLALQQMSAQKSENAGDYNYRRAIEILDEDGDSEEARKLLNENISECPRHIKSYLLLVSMYRQDSDYASAMRTLNKAMKNNHKSSGVSESKLIWWKASVYDDMGDYQNAVALMEQALGKGRKQDKGNLDLMLEAMAQFYYNVKNYDSSDAAYREMLKIDDSALLPRVGLARNMIARERYDEALAMLEECMKFDGDYDEIYRFKVKAYEGKKDYKKMIDAMITLYEKSGDADYLDIDRFMKDRKYSFAIVKEKIADSKDNTLWRVVLASLYQEAHMYSEVIPLLDGIMYEYGVNEDLLEERADCYDSMGLYELALADITKAIEICDGQNEAYYYALRSDVYRGAGLYDEAIEDATRFLDRFPARAYGYYARGWCKELSGDLDGAMVDYNDGIAVDEDYPYIYLMRGSLYLKNGEVEKAMEDFETVVAKDTTVESGSCRQYALNFLGRVEEAEEWMKKVLELDPDDPGNWYDKACLYARMGRVDESVAALMTAFEKGYRHFAHLEFDDDMDSVRDREDFKALVDQYRKVLGTEVMKSGENLVEEKELVVSEILMKKNIGGTYEVPCSVNGLPLKMIFDTGAADVTISLVEANFMLKNGYLSREDIKGKRNYITASGDIHEGTILRLKEVKLGEAVLKNVEASVVHSQKAPLLLGQSVLEKFGTITIDNVNLKLFIKQ